jgi:hypothetical protein
MDTHRISSGPQEPRNREEAEAGDSDEADAHGPGKGGTGEAAMVCNLEALIQSKDADDGQQQPFKKG